jgi:hypothetical protein
MSVADDDQGPDDKAFANIEVCNEEELCGN